MAYRDAATGRFISYAAYIFQQEDFKLVEPSSEPSRSTERAGELVMSEDDYLEYLDNYEGEPQEYDTEEGEY